MFTSTPVRLELSKSTLAELQARAAAHGLTVDDYVSNCITLNIPMLNTSR